MSFFRNFFDNNQPGNHDQYDDQTNCLYTSNNQSGAHHNTQYHEPYNPDNYQLLQYQSSYNLLTNLNRPLPLVRQLFPETELGHCYFATGRGARYLKINLVNNQETN